MKHTIIILLLLTALALISFKPGDESPLKKSVNMHNVNSFFSFDAKELNGNNVSTWFENNGGFNREPVYHGSGLEWPIGSNKHLSYTSGIWIAGIAGQDTLEAIASFSNEFAPGIIDNNGNPQGGDEEQYHVYKIVKGDTLSNDYLNWPVGQGAYLDSNNKPFLPGTQTLFYSMSDGYVKLHRYTMPMKAQVQVTSWCYNSVSDPVISNTIFTEFKIINKNSVTWNDAVISVWSDECSVESIANGCDTNLNLGYSYCNPNSWQYGNNPPSHGFMVLQGPVKFTGSHNDTVRFFVPGKNGRIIRTGYKEIKMSSFNMFINGSLPNGLYGQPTNRNQVYLTMQGFHRTGDAWINPVNSQITKYAFPGDPESGTGWYQSANMGFGNRRLLMNFGLLNIEPGDTQSVIMAQIVSQGTNNLNSVTKLKQNSQYIKNVFENNFTTVTVNESNSISLPTDFKLYQNYPNPFNPVTKIRYNLSKAGHVILKVYDISGKEVITLVDERHDAGENEVTFSANGGRSNLASGVYFCKLTVNDNLSAVRKMVLQK